MPVKKTSKKRVPMKKSEDHEQAHEHEYGHEHEHGGEHVAHHEAVPLLLYRRIALTFMFIVCAALITILYLSTVQAVIHINSAKAPLSASFITDVLAAPVEDGDVRGAVAVGTVGKTQTFTASGEGKKQVDGVATGEVTIYNNLGFDQQLVVRTRLLSPEGVLFRLKEGVVAPAGGEVTAKVYADEPGGAGDIAPTRFAIPGLSSARQEAVYAQSTAAFTGGMSEVAVVSQKEIDAAVATLKAALENDALAMLRTQAGGQFTGAAHTSKIVEQAVSVAAGEEAAQYDVTLSLNVAAVFYDRDALQEIASRKLYEGLGQGQAFANIDTDGMQVEVAGYDEDENRANVRVTVSGATVNAATSEALRADRFIGLKEEDVRTLLVNKGIATHVDVEFFPFWIKTVPRLQDHIYIDIR